MISVLIFIINIRHEVYCQDEFMYIEKCRLSDFNLKITRLSTDTLFFKAFGRKKYVLNSDLMGYRYKDSSWTFFKEEYKTQFSNNINPANTNPITKTKKDPAEVMLLDGSVTDFNLSLVSINEDTLFYEAFSKLKFYLLTEILAYRKLNVSAWIYVNTAYEKGRNVYKGKNTSEFNSRKKYLEKHVISNKSAENLVRKNNYAIYFDGSRPSLNTIHLEKNKYIGVQFINDTIKHLYVLPLVKIVNDSLYFAPNYFDYDYHFSACINEISFLVIDPIFPSIIMPITERMELESTPKLFEMAFKSKNGFWLKNDSGREKVNWKIKDLGY